SEGRAVVAVVGTRDPESLRVSIDQVNALATHPVTVFLPDGATIGAPIARSSAVDLAAHGQSFSVADPAGREIVVAVQSGDRTAGIPTFLPPARLAPRGGPPRATPAAPRPALPPPAGGGGRRPAPPPGP